MRRTPFVLLQVGNLLSGAGNGVAMVVLPWLVLEITGSATAAGGIAAATLVPVLLSSLVVGTFIDMVGRKRVALLADAPSGISTAGIPLLAVLGMLDLGAAGDGSGARPVGLATDDPHVSGRSQRAERPWVRRRAATDPSP